MSNFNGTDGFIINDGPSADQFGFSVAGIGDSTQSGVNEIALGIGAAIEAGMQKSGRILIVSDGALSQFRSCSLPKDVCVSMSQIYDPITELKCEKSNEICLNDTLYCSCVDSSQNCTNSNLQIYNSTDNKIVQSELPVGNSTSQECVDPSMICNLNNETCTNPNNIFDQNNQITIDKNATFCYSNNTCMKNNSAVDQIIVNISNICNSTTQVCVINSEFMVVDINNTVCYPNNTCLRNYSFVEPFCVNKSIICNSTNVLNSSNVTAISTGSSNCQNDCSQYILFIISWLFSGLFLIIILILIVWINRKCFKKCNQKQGQNHALPPVNPFPNGSAASG